MLDNYLLTRYGSNLIGWGENAINIVDDQDLDSNDDDVDDDISYNEDEYCIFCSEE